MKNHRSHTLAGALLILLSFVMVAIASKPHQGPNQKPVIFKSPSGYMPAPLSGHTGQMFLDAGRPAGMFVGYPKDGQDMNTFTDEIKKMVASMFLHEAKDPQWTSAPLPAHKDVDSESGSLFSTGDDKMEVQLAFYARPEGVAYGYFGMRHKKSKSDDAKFVDANGAGVKAFDDLAKSIKFK